jgi:hypothetical protein
MKLVDKNELERRAASMVVAELGAARFVERDVRGAPSGTRDFDIVFNGGREEPLEVTTNLNTVVMRAFGRADGGSFELPANVQRYWVVSANQTFTDTNGRTVPFDRKRVTELLPPVIEQLERTGETYFDTDRLAWPFGGRGVTGYEQPARELYYLGITRGISGEVRGEKPRISVHLGGGGSWGPDTIPRVLGAIAALPDNVAKLEARPGAQRRHLFVVLAGSGSTDMAGWALTDFLRGSWIWDEPPGVPELPDPITTIWAGTTAGGIYATPPGGWHRFGTAPA